MNHSWTALQARAVQHWQSLSAREQKLLRISAALLGLALLWWLALAPALRVLAGAEAERARLTRQWQQLQWVVNEAAQLRPRAQAGGETSAEALRKIGEGVFGSAPQMLEPQSDAASKERRVLVMQFTLRAVSAERLAEGLAALRLNAHARILSADLRRAPGGTGGALWNGTIHVALPQR